MRHAVLALVISLTSFWAGGAFAMGAGSGANKVKKTAGTEQPVSCESNVSRIGFTDKIDGGQPFELWKCQDQWHLSNLGNLQVYVNDDGKPCIKESGKETCCPNVAAKDSTLPDAAPKEERIATSFSCRAPAGSDPNPKPDQMTDLVIEPAAQNGNRSSTTYRITNDSIDDPNDNSPKPKKLKGLRIEVDKPTGNGPNQKTGSIAIRQDSPGSSFAPSKTNKGGPSDPCTQAATKENGGAYCQLPANILGHHYQLNKDTKGAVKDPDQQSGDLKTVNTDGTGRNETSEGGTSSGP